MRRRSSRGLGSSSRNHRGDVTGADERFRVVTVLVEAHLQQSVYGLSFPYMRKLHMDERERM